MNIDFRRLKYFFAVANNLSFTEAAKELYLTTQGMNKQIMKLEEEIGCQLFERTTRNVKLTDEGEKLYEVFEQVVREYELACKDFESYKDKRQKVLKIGYFSGISRDKIIQPVVQYMRGFKKDIPISLHTGEMDTVIEWLEKGDIDMCITNVFDYEHWMMYYEMIKLKVQPAYAVTSMCHPWVEKTKLDIKDFEEYPMLISRHLSEMPKESVYRQIKSKEKVYVENFNSLIINLETGPYFSIIPKDFDGMENLKLKYYDLPEELNFNFSTVIVYSAEGKFGKELEDLTDITEEMEF